MRREQQLKIEEEECSDQEMSENLNIEIGHEDQKEMVEHEDPEFIIKCDALLEKITQDYRSNRDAIRDLKKQYRHEMKVAKKNCRKRKTSKKTGFTKSEVVPSKLAKLIGVEKGTTMPRTQLTKEIYAVIKDRGLYYDNDKRVLRADKELRKIFNLSKNVNESTNPHDVDGFNFFNIQTHIALCYNEKGQNKTRNK